MMIITTAWLCLSLNIYHEARDQSLEGRIAVAEVTMNRAKWDQEKICAVVFKPRQFTWANSLTTVSAKQRIKNAPRFMPKEEGAWRDAKELARTVIAGKAEAVIGSANHYYNPAKANPSWAKTMTHIATIGDHEFYKNG